MGNSAVLIDVHDVRKTYTRGAEAVTALNSVSLQVGRSELVAITGPSGSGKTTLVHVLGGLTKPDSGEVIIAGEHISRYSDARLSRYRNKTVGFVFQNFNLLPYYSALENVMVPLLIAGVTKSKRIDEGLRSLESIGLAHKASARANELSGGERQRVAIARALVTHPRIIIADEPTGSLDSMRAGEIMTIFQSLAHKHNVTIVMVTHDNQLAAKADTIITLRDGTIVR